MESYHTLTALNFVLKLFSLHNISYKNKFIVNRWPYVKVALFLILFGSLFANSLYIHYTDEHFTKSSPSVVVTDAAIAILSYIQFILDLYFVYIYRNKTCVYYNVYDQIDKAIAMKYYSEIKRKVFTLVSIFLLSWLLSTLVDYGVWSSEFGWLWALIYSANYFMALIRTLTIMDINSQTLHIKYRLKTLIDKIEECALLADDASTCIKVVESKRYSKVQNRAKIAPFIINCHSDVTKLNSYYLLLHDQTTFLNSFFGVRMLLHCFLTLCEIINFINIVARFFNGTSSVFTRFLSVAASSTRCFNYVATLFSLIYYCETCCHLCSVIVDAIDCLLVNKRCTGEVLSSLTVLRRLVSSRPLRFQAAGFFRLDSTLLLSTASVVITYAVVLVQNTP